MKVMQLSCRILAASYNKIKIFSSLYQKPKKKCFYFSKNFLFYMAILVSVLATGKLQTPNPRAQYFFQTPIFSPPLPKKQKKILG